MNIPPRQNETKTEFLQKILFVNNHKKIVTSQNELEKAATWITIEILCVGVPLSRIKSRKNPTVVMPTAKTECIVNSVRVYET